MPSTSWLLPLLAASAVTATAHARPQPPTVSVFARAVQPGEVVRLDVRCQCPGGPPTAAALGRDVPLARDADDRWVGLIGLDLETAPGTYSVTVTSGAGEAATTDLEVAPKHFTVRRLRVASRFVEPPPRVQARIAAEAEQLTALFGTTTPRRWDRPFRLPVEQRPVSNFGTRSVFNGQPRSPHGGVDFASPTGTPVHSPSSGRVVLAKPLYFTGNTVIVDHGQGLYSLFAHLSAFAVADGDEVARGDVLGRTGATGRVTGPHLHWTVRLGSQRVDPLSLVAALN